jgi:tRNA threonylcarbamoyladenosine biosynthesis protein TsaB
VNILAIETSMGRCSVAVVTGGVATESFLPEGTTPAESLLPLVSNVMSKTGIAFRDLNRIVVCTGPGGFSSIRTGVAAAKGIGLAARVPVYGATSFRIMAHSLCRKATVLLCAKAGLDAFYLQVADRGQPREPIVYLPARDAAQFAATAGYALAGPGAEALAAAAEGALGVVSMQGPGAKALAEIAHTLDPACDKPDPVYVRPADARPQLPIITARPHASADR